MVFPLYYNEEDVNLRKKGGYSTEYIHRPEYCGHLCGHANWDYCCDCYRRMQGSKADMCTVCTARNR